MKDIYNNDMISTIGIYENKEYIGEVVYTDDWDSDKTVKVYIPELMPFYKSSRHLISSIEAYKIGKNIVKAKTDIGLISKQVIINGQLLKPNIGDNVVVKFINGDVKKCVFYTYNYTYDPKDYRRGDK